MCRGVIFRSTIEIGSGSWIYLVHNLICYKPEAIPCSPQSVQQWIEDYSEYHITFSNNQVLQNVDASEGLSDYGSREVFVLIVV